MLTASQKSELEGVLQKKIEKIEHDIKTYEELTKPISPENAIGRISRMDAINNKSVHEAALRNARKKLSQLKRSLLELLSSEFGLCRQCEEYIEFEKLKAFPESVLCVKCVKNARK